MLSVQMKQRVNIKFLVKLGKTLTEACAMIKEVYGNECLCRTQVSEWIKRFKEGRETTEDDTRPGPSTSKTNENTEEIDTPNVCVLKIVINKQKDPLKRTK
ncbi:hypothetical protein NQ318_006181 [Aromia moschata]|uniref:Mos1 transposase HTH domain-containing protein n=1 Tax=Aromia moschata TaxID=1265417 RepID=A0AAV8XSG3_9CUCU|nr:hypothetical protein NQ318_006181 [Aromia moschata]